MMEQHRFEQRVTVTDYAQLVVLLLLSLPVIVIVGIPMLIVFLIKWTNGSES